MKIKKDWVTSVRINSQILAMLKKQGLSPQKILDNYIDLNFIAQGDIIRSGRKHLSSFRKSIK